jgi:hypothetical protein
MFFMPACVVGAAVITVVVGAAGITVVVGAAVITVVVGAAVITVVTIGTGVGVTVVGFWVAHPANSTPAVIKTAKIRKIRFLSMTESPYPCFYRYVLPCYNDYKEFSTAQAPLFNLISAGVG